MAIFSRPAQSGRHDSQARRSEPAGLTIIAIGTTIVGDVVSEGVVKVEGNVEGTIRAGSQLLVAQGAMIRGDVFASEIVAGGEIHGGVTAGERVEIQVGADGRRRHPHPADSYRGRRTGEWPDHDGTGG